MNNAEIVLEVLDDIRPEKYCDDCLSDELQIKPRQQINQICRRLADQGMIIRERSICSSCKKQKLTNLLGAVVSSSQSDLQIRESAAVYYSSSASDINIESLRTQIAWICRDIWSKHKNDSPPHSISVIINSLKSDEFIPFHQANMMLTLCNLRNVYVYEKLKLGQREKTIASNAWSIISEWWSKISDK